jgi:putative oxidoreductase
MKRNSSATDMLSLCLRMILGVIFFYAGIIKILDPQGFALAVYNYHILPGFLINPVAVILPWVEVIAGAALILGILVPGAALIVSGLLAVFLCALAAALVRGLDISCGCFNTSEDADPITWMYLLRDMALLGSTVFVFLYDQGRYGVVKIIRKKDPS